MIIIIALFSFFPILAIGTLIYRLIFGKWSLFQFFNLVLAVFVLPIAMTIDLIWFSLEHYIIPNVIDIHSKYLLNMPTFTMVSIYAVMWIFLLLFGPILKFKKHRNLKDIDYSMYICLNIVIGAIILMMVMGSR